MPMKVRGRAGTSLGRQNRLTMSAHLVTLPLVVLAMAATRARAQYLADPARRSTPTSP